MNVRIRHYLLLSVLLLCIVLLEFFGDVKPVGKIDINGKSAWFIYGPFYDDYMKPLSPSKGFRNVFVKKLPKFLGSNQLDQILYIFDKWFSNDLIEVKIFFLNRRWYLEADQERICDIGRTEAFDFSTHSFECFSDDQVHAFIEAFFIAKKGTARYELELIEKCSRGDIKDFEQRKLTTLFYRRFNSLSNLDLRNLKKCIPYLRDQNAQTSEANEILDKITELAEAITVFRKNRFGSLIE